VPDQVDVHASDEEKRLAMLHVVYRHSHPAVPSTPSRIMGTESPSSTDLPEIHVIRSSNSDALDRS